MRKIVEDLAAMSHIMSKLEPAVRPAPLSPISTPGYFGKNRSYEDEGGVTSLRDGGALRAHA